MPRQLPSRAHLRQLKHQAKDIVRSHARKEPAVCALLRNLRRFDHASDEQMLSAELALHEAQYALALEYGFTSWDALKRRVEGAGEPSSSSVQRDADRVYVRRLENVAWGGAHPKQNSVIAAFEAACAAAGDTIGYDELMGASGAAFRLQHKWCPSSPNARCGFNCIDPAARAAGYAVEWIAADDCRTGSYAGGLEHAHASAVASIDEGRPVLLSSEECGLIVGYAESGEWLIRPYDPKDDGYVLSADWPWDLGILRRSAGAPERFESAVNALSTAVMLANTASFGPYASGFAAFESWAKELGEEERFRDPSTWFGVTLGNAYTYSCLSETRATATRYLRELATWMPEPTRADLLAASEQYEQVSSLVARPIAGELSLSMLYPWRLGSPAAWKPEHRKAQAEALTMALKHERKAVASLEHSLSQLGVVRGGDHASG